MRNNKFVKRNKFVGRQYESRIEAAIEKLNDLTTPATLGDIATEVNLRTLIVRQVLRRLYRQGRVTFTLKAIPKGTKRHVKVYRMKRGTKSKAA